MGQSQSTRSSEPGASYRAKAAAEAQARADASRKSQAAFKASSYNSAKAYSLSARKHQQKMSEYNTLASNEIFRHHNPNYPTAATNSSLLASSFFGVFFSLFTAGPNDLSQLDLHGQHVNEAIPMVKDHLERCRREGVQRTTVITGRGAHSVGGVAKIKPKVEELLADMRVRYRKDGPGAFVVECGRQGDGGIVGWILRGIFG